MRGFPQRILVGVLGPVAIAVLIGCPPVQPPPNGPGGAGGSPPPPPASVTCQAACQHAKTVCPGVDTPTCETLLCGRLGTVCAGKLVAAMDCPGVKAACR